MTDKFVYTIESNPANIEDVKVTYKFSQEEANPLTMSYADMMGIALANMLARETHLYGAYLEEVMRRVAQARLEVLRDAPEDSKGLH